ncbi:MAG: alkaline phosphatase family protein, partial [Gemmatimonadota bacterium]
AAYCYVYDRGGVCRVLVVFIEGVGSGAAVADANPFKRARLDAFTRLAASGTFVPLDATLGVPGLPQSGTGQTALFTGINAAAEFGRHFGPWVPTALRARLAHQNFLTRAQQAGRAVAFANAYPEELFEKGAPASGRVADPLRAGPPIAALGAGVLNRHTPELMRGDALASEITNDGWRQRLQRVELPVISAVDAGRNLARIAARHDLTLFAHYSTDYVGHRGHMAEAVAALETVDAFLAGLAGAMADDLLVAVVSDHGNIEDIRTGHTHNPAIGLFFGPGHERFAAAASITAVAPIALSVLADT